MEQQVRACFTPLSGTLTPPPVDESPWGGTGAMHVFTAGGLRSGAHRAGETRPTQTWHHTEHMNRMSPHTRGQERGSAQLVQGQPPTAWSLNALSKRSGCCGSQASGLCPGWSQALPPSQQLLSPLFASNAALGEGSQRPSLLPPPSSPKVSPAWAPFLG